MRRQFVVSYENSEDYFRKLRKVYAGHNNAIVVPDPEFIRLIEAGKVECTSLTYYIDKKVYKIVTDTIVAFFSVNVSSTGVKFIKDFSMKEKDNADCSISNIQYMGDLVVTVNF